MTSCDRLALEDFGRRVVADYSTTEAECYVGVFRLRMVFDANAREDWSDAYKAGGAEQREKWKAFRDHVLDSIHGYVVPVIKLTKETPKEAVCTVFEKVNTGGVPLNVFELLTATFAGDASYFREHGQDFSLIDDWKRISTELEKHQVLAKLENIDFLQAVSLLATRERRHNFVGRPDSSPKAPAISCKRGDMLKLSLVDYLQWRGRLIEAFEWCGQVPDAAVRLSCSRSAVPQSTCAARCDLVGFRADLDLAQDQCVLVGGCGEQVHLVALGVDGTADGLAIDRDRDQRRRFGCLTRGGGGVGGGFSGSSGGLFEQPGADRGVHRGGVWAPVSTRHSVVFDGTARRVWRRAG